MARKKEDRDSGKYKRLANKSKKSHEGNEDAETLRAQLLPLGLQLREVPGDGNCLFRALGDQLDGHMGNHYRHRQDTTTYMLENREDFQPFVEDDVPFEKHINQLSQLGTYAGNDAIVAFARLHQVAVVIHQPNTPLWQIKGWEAESAPSKKGKGKGPTNQNKLGRQLHIAYHGGDHYDSVRRLGDTSHVPANILIDIENNTTTETTTYATDSYSSAYHQDEQHYDYGVDDSTTDLEQQAMERSGCQDLPTVRQLLYNNCGNLDAAVEDLIALMSSSGDQQDLSMSSSSAISHRSRTGHLSRKQLEKIKKQERKRASEARKKVSGFSESSSSSIPDETVVIGKVQCLNI